MQAQLVRLAPNQIGRQLIVRSTDEEESSHQPQCNGRNVNPVVGEEEHSVHARSSKFVCRRTAPVRRFITMWTSSRPSPRSRDSWIYVDRDQKYLLLLPGTVRPRRSGSHIDLPTITMSR